MRNNEEYVVCRQISQYLRYQYPKVLFHFDMAGLNLSKAQAGMNKAIQHGRGYPDLVILEHNKFNRGLFIEVKRCGEKIFKKDNITFRSVHIEEQYNILVALLKRGYHAVFGIGFDNCKEIIDNYMKNR